MRVAMLSVHTSPLAQPGGGDGGRYERLDPFAWPALARRGGGRRDAPTTPSSHRSSRSSGGSACCTSRSGRAHQYRAALPELVAVREAARHTLARQWHRLRRAARELLGIGRGRALARARARPHSSRRSIRSSAPRPRWVSTTRSPAPPRRGGGRAPRRPGRRGDGRRAAAARPLLRRRSGSGRGRPPGRRPHPVRPRGHGRRQALAGRGRRTGLLFVGRIQALKGADLAVRALAEPLIHGQCSRWWAVRAGPTASTRLALRSLVDDLGLDAAGAVRAPRTPRGPRPLLPGGRRVRGAVAQGVVRPRRLEAAACGTPAVASNVGGLRIVVDDGVTGLLVDDRDPRAFADAIDCAPARRPRGISARSEARVEVPLEHRGGPLRRHYHDLSARAPVQCSWERRDRRRLRRRPPGRARALVAAHLEGPVAAEDHVQAVEYDPELRRWYVRFGARRRDATTIYFDLHQRTLRYEVYFLPVPPAKAWRALPAGPARQPHHVRRALSLGPDGDLYLAGRVPLEHLTLEELDRIIGVLYELTDRWFQPVVRLAHGRPPSGPSHRRDACACLRRKVALYCPSRRRALPGVRPEVQDGRPARGSAGPT